MKNIILTLLLVFFAFNAEATFVRGYYRKDGTYVSPHYRSSPTKRYYLPATYSGYSGASTSTASQSSAQPYVPHTPITTTPAQLHSINQTWLNYYKSAAMITGDTSNLGKVEYICRFKEAESLWESLQSELSFCSTRGCFIEHITTDYRWRTLNDKINNVYNYIKSSEK